MVTEARKLSLIEAIIKSSDDSILNAIEAMVFKDETANGAPSKFTDLLGVLTEEEAHAMTQTIDENFEKVNPNDWK